MKSELKILTELAKKVYDMPLEGLTPLQLQELLQSLKAEHALNNMNITDRIHLLLSGAIKLKTGKDIKDKRA